MRFLPVAAAFVLSFAMTLVLRPLARRAGIVAPLRTDRWHRRPTPLLGGVAIFAGFAVPVLVLGQATEVVAPVVLGLLLAGVGLADDIRRLSPGTKLTAQMTVAAVALFLGYRLGWTGSVTFDLLLTLLWLVGLTNAFNLLDNMDGLAAGVAAVGSTAYLVLAATHGTPADVLLFGALTGSILGFLVFNFHPATIFMGDAGSLFLGFTLALLSVRLEPGTGTGGAAAIVVPIAVLSVPIFDTTLVTFVRGLAGRRISVGGRDHSSHRLVALGFPERQAVLVLYAFAGIAALAGLSVFYLDLSHANIVLGLFLVALTFFGVHLTQVRVYEPETKMPEPSSTVAVVLEAVSGWAPVIDVALDVCVITLAYYTAYRIRFDDRDFLHFFPVFISSLPVVLAMAVVSLWWAGAYRGIWKFFGLRDALVLLRAVALGTVCSVAAVSYLFRFEGYSRAVFAIYAGLVYLLLVSGRASFRFVHELTGAAAVSRRRVVIYGVGENGLAVLHDAQADRLGVQVIGFIDDDPAAHGRDLQGVLVLGGLDTLLELIRQRAVEGVLVSSAKIARDRMRRLGPACKDHGVFLVRFRWGFQNLLAGQAAVAVKGEASEANEEEVFPTPKW